MIEIDGNLDSPYEIAHKLITATVKEKLINGREYDAEAYSLLELKQIGLHLLHYAETEQLSDEEE